jgi:hypothetical protein
MMYERRIENSMLKMMNELKSQQIMREMKEANAVEENPGGPGVNLKKQRQSPAFGRKSEARNPKSETILQNKDNSRPLAGNSKHEARNPKPEEDLKKQSQFTPAEIGVNSFVGERYESRRAGRLRENKAKTKPIAGLWPEILSTHDFAEVNSSP